jgi:primosomal protein N' (replication factor Y)
VDGAPETLEGLEEAVNLPSGAELLGPVPLPAGRTEPDRERERLLIRVPRSQSRALAAALAALQAGRSARKLPDPLRVELDLPPGS